MISELRSALIAAVVGGLVAYVFQYYGEAETLKKTARLETVLAYTNSESPLTPFATKYIAAITGSGDLKTAQVELRGKVADEMERAEKLKPMFRGVEPLIEQYVTALVMFSESIDGATDATKMRAWTERFGHVVDTRMALEKRLLAVAGA
ncbi:hypothetical protein [Agrobacterium tumefaciens]|uniref:Uncharacterized protein n=1 Tax=Agrobacterium tumefaciens TaxID=358 RepID=A0A2L2LC93_AGRTU|nr:hypothetical protein [Agrobacterium tumefaciens]AVH41975.1 hypothetical protein At1D1609_19210 [Agrobacterium tumefaciens]NSY95888.1 hypothetical protein [Agrobacterium tumefaciens]